MVTFSEEVPAEGAPPTIVEIRSDASSYELLSDAHLMGDEDMLVPSIEGVEPAASEKSRRTNRHTVKATARIRMFHARARRRVPDSKHLEGGDAGDRPIESLSWVRRDREEAAKTRIDIEHTIKEQILGKLPLAVDLEALELALTRGAQEKLPDALLNEGRAKLNKARTAQEAKRERERQAELARLREEIKEVFAAQTVLEPLEVDVDLLREKLQ